MSAMKILVAGGTGFIGQAFIKDRLSKGDTILVVGRNKQKINAIFKDEVTAITWEQLDSKRLAHCDLVLNLTGANIGDKLWSQKRKDEILQSRVSASERLAVLCANLKNDAPRLFNASAIGTYGLQTTDNELPQALDENTAIDFNHYPDFLSEVGRKWEAATQIAKDAGVNVVNLRFAVVLNQSGGMLKKLLPIFKLGLGQIIASGKQAFSWVSLADVINAINFLIDKPEINGPINIVAPNCVTQKQFAKTFAKALHRPCFLHLPKFAVHSLFGQMGDELLIRGQNIYPTKLLELGYHFINPTLNDFFNQQ